MVAACAAFASLAQEKKEPAKSESAAKKHENEPKKTQILSEYLPKGDYDKVSAVTVEFPPGAEAHKHRHDVAVVGYVLEGSIESQFEGDALKTLKKGDSWYERPGTVHVVARNASKSEPAKVLVVYVAEPGAVPTTVIKEEPKKEEKPKEEKAKEAKPKEEKPKTK
jgi:quercetin dioxygenase-like cupin family protein